MKQLYNKKSINFSFSQVPIKNYIPSNRDNNFAQSIAAKPTKNTKYL